MEKHYDYELLSLSVKKAPGQSMAILRAEVRKPSSDSDAVPFYDPPPIFFHLYFPLSETPLPRLDILAEDLTEIWKEWKRKKQSSSRS